MVFDPDFWEDERVIELVLRFEKMLRSSREEYFDIDDFIDIIDIYLQRNKLDGAEKAVDIALKLHPLSIEILTLKADVHLKKTELNKALKVLKFAQSIDDGSIDLILTWGFYYHKCKQYQKAKIFFERAINKSVGDELQETLVFISQFYSEENDQLQSIEYFKRLYELDPENTMVALDLAGKHFELEEYDSALKLIEAYLDIDPFDYMFWRLKGDIYQTLNEIAEAINAYEISLAIEPNNYLAHYGLSNLYFLQKEYEKSIEVFSLYSDVFYEDEYSYYNIACCYYEMGEYQTSIDNYIKSMTLDPNPEPFLTWLGLGKVYYKLGNISESYKYLKKTLNKNPHLDYAWLYLGYVQLKLGHFNHAVRSFERAAHYNPENDDTWMIYFKTTYYHLGVNKAYDVVCKIIEKNPSKPEFLLYKTACLIELNQIDEAEQVFNTAITQKVAFEEFFNFYPKINNIEKFKLIINKYK